MTSSPIPALDAIPDTKLREILDGCEGVTPGPWVSEGDRSEDEPDKGCGVIASNSVGEISNPSRGLVLWAHGFREEAVGNANHIARLDPATVSSIVSELLRLRANHTARADVAEGYVLRLETIIRESCKQLNSIIDDGIPTDWRAWLVDLEAALAASPSQGDSA